VSEAVVEITREMLDRDYPLPRIDGGNKDAHGSILIIAGSRDVAGAGLLTATAAMRAGAGRLQIATVASAAPHLAMAMPEAMVIGVPQAQDGGFTESATADLADRAGKAATIVAGPGMQRGCAAEQLTAALLATGRPLVLDAALLHALPARAQDAKRSDCPTVLLPRVGEMASLLGCDPEAVEADPVGCGTRCADRYDAVTLVKGVQSHIVAPDGRCWHFTGGGPGLGISGSGDTLAGIVGGLLARGADPVTALLWAVYLHGEAGRRLGERIGTLGYLAREIPGEVPAILFRT
jgi:ADP-dependent NAD(P)H-hydrate dehydratase